MRVTYPHARYLSTCELGFGLCCWHFVKRVCVPAESEVPVMGTRRRLTPEYRRDVASLVLDTGSTNRVCGDGGFAPLEALPRRVAGVSRLKCCNSPRLAAVRLWFEVAWSRFGVVWRPKCRPPRRKTPIMGCRGRGGLRFGQNCLGHGVLFAREPAIACANRLFRT